MGTIQTRSNQNRSQFSTIVVKWHCSEQIMGLNLPTGIPFVYEFDENMKPTKSMQFLGDEETVKAAMEKVAAQTGKK